jgi:hypothetical protein
MYRQYKTKLQAALSHVGIHPPHIIDASWTLDFCVKVSYSCMINESLALDCYFQVNNNSKLLLKNLHAGDSRLLKVRVVPKYSDFCDLGLIVIVKNKILSCSQLSSGIYCHVK